jgi:hypothetical protein
MATPFRFERLALLCPLLAALSMPAQAQSPAIGHRVYSPTGQTNTFLVDDQGDTVHTWPSSNNPGNTVYVEDDGILLRTVRTGVSGPGGGTGGGIERLALDGTLRWSFDYDTGGNIHHHDVESLPNGNVLLIAWETMTQAEAIAAGRNPALVTSASFFPDHIIEVTQTGLTTGSIVWEWHIWDHLIQDFDMTKANFGDVGAHSELVDINFPATNTSDWNHVNSLDYDTENDWIVISANFQDEFWIVDHSTTTAEAAGHIGGDHGKGGDLLYRWGNPQSYRAGTGADKKLFRQHGVKFIGPGLSGAGNILLYNNQISPTSRVEEIELPLDAMGNFIFGGVFGPAAPVWTYQDAAMSSAIMSSAERLPNGNTLICSSLQGRIFEITTTGTNVWEIATPTAFRVSYVERNFWTNKRELSVDVIPNDSLDFDLIAGSKHAGDAYILFASLSGTSPGINLGAGLSFPLNLDAFSNLAFMFANSVIFTDYIGILDGSGRATASLVMPGIAPATLIGLTVHHAYVVTDPAFTTFKAVSNAENAIWVP